MTFNQACAESLQITSGLSIHLFAGFFCDIAFIDFTFLAWQYSFSITFPRTHGRLEVPVAAKAQQRRALNKDSAETRFNWNVAAVDDASASRPRSAARNIHTN